ncbi:MAG TPA: hypothetical protein VHS99_01485 [Chloroflexota bacterium]|nr:hypothetical protein [Chloroflexota bacterium]
MAARWLGGLRRGWRRPSSGPPGADRRAGERDRAGNGADELREIERYLRRLRRCLPRVCREEMVAEARRHLYDATRRAAAGGAGHQAAQRAALRAFGPAWRIALEAHRAYGTPPLTWLSWLGSCPARLRTGLRTWPGIISLRPWRRSRTP